MVDVCITKDKRFRDRAKAFNISIDTLEHITYKYYEETSSIDKEPSDTYIKAQLGEFPYIEKEDVVEAAHRMWEMKYSKPLEFNSEIEMLQVKTLAETYFPKKAIHVYTNSQGKQILAVQEPVEKISILYRKDFPDWHNYNDYLIVMGDAIPQAERQKEPRKTGPQSFTFNDGVTVTAPFQPNEQQVEALNAMSDFINSDEVSMTLSGYAGTGKTSLMELIAAKMKKQHRNIVFSASTNKAAAVLRDRVKKSGFTAQTLNKVFGISVEVDSTKPYDAANLVNKLKEAEISRGTIVVIDEASMINEENYRILNGIAKENGLKIIYTGDKGQLAPVGEAQVSKVFRDKNGRVVTLTKVERTDDNAILKEATAIRNGQPLSGESSFNSEGKGVAYIKPTNKEAKKAIVEAFVPMLKKNPDFFRILAFTNKAVADYNTAVRNVLGYHDNTPRVGEPIVGYSNWGAEYDRRTKQTTYRFINSESYKVVEVNPAKQVYYSLDDGTRIQMTAIPITIEDAMGKREKVDLMDIKGNPQNLQAATILAKEKARLFSVARQLPRREQPAVYQKINGIEKFLFVNDNIKEGNRTLQAKTFDFGYAMTVHKSQGSTFTHVLVDDADISTARNQTAPSSFDASVSMLDGPYAAMEGAQAVDLGLDSASSDMQVTSQGNLFAQMQQQPKVLNTQTINREANNAANLRQQLEYVAISRATDTVTIISNNVKKEGSPLITQQAKPAQVQPQTAKIELPKGKAGKLTEDNIQKHSGNWSRQEAENNPNILYVFTDNTDRDSGSGKIPADSWYSKKYGEGHHFPTMTAAVVRGLENARPISTQRWYHAGAKGTTGRWTDADVAEFKQVIREELEEIVREFSTGKYDTIMFPDGDGLFNTNISNITKTRTPQLYQALGELLQEFGLTKLVPEDAINPADNRSNNEINVLDANQVQGENITSKGSEFAKKLTNPGNNLEVVYKGRTFRNAEHAYQTWKSGEFDEVAYKSDAFKPRGSKPVNKQTNYQTMVEIITAKLQQHPDLVQGITERGGMDYLNASTHNVTNDPFWETSGQNKFMEALKEAYNKVLQDVKEQKTVISNLEDNLGGGEQATAEVQDAVKIAKKGMSFEEILAGQEAFFSKEEQAQIKQGLNGRNLQVMSVSRLTDPAFFSKEIVSFLERNAEKPLNNPTRVTAIEIWSKHDGLPIKDILDACKKYRVAPMVSFSITGLGGTALEGGVMKYQDMLEKVGKLIKNGTLNPATTTVRIDPILPGVTNMEDIRKIVEAAKSYGIKKFVTSLVQSYGYTEGTPRDRKVVSGINNALATEGKTYDWDKYYGRDRNGKINFKPKQEVINEIGKVLLELDKDPEITIQTCAFGINGLKVSACLDPMIIERITGVDVLRKDGTYDRDTSRPECMCYGCHGDFFKGQNKKCYSSCAYCYAAHSGDNKLNYYNEDGTLKDNDYTKTERIQQGQQQNVPASYEEIITPDANTVFVFGSNPKGIHGAGAAATAKAKFGAIQGQGEGLQGNAYALPTKDLDKAKGTRWYKPGKKEETEIKEWYKNHDYSEVLNHPLNAERTMTPQQIIESIKKLYEVANQNPDKQFKVSHYPFGQLSLNGYLGEEMLAMFKQAGQVPSNIVFNKEWTDHWGEIQSTQQQTNNFTVDEIYNQLKSQYAPNSSEAKLTDIVFQALRNTGMEFKAADLGEGVSGRFVASENTILYNPNALQSNTLLHEAIHAVTSYYLEAENTQGFSKEIKVAIQEIEECYNLLKQDFIEEWKKKGVEINDSNFSLWIEGNDTYGLTDPKEMIAELGKPEFVEHIKNFDRRHKGQNIFQRLKNAIFTLFGINKNYGNLESTLKNALVTLLTNPSNELIQRYSQENTNVKNNHKVLVDSKHISINNEIAVKEMLKNLSEVSSEEYADTSIVLNEESIPYSFTQPEGANVTRLSALKEGSIFVYNNAVFMSLNGTPRLENGKAIIPIRVYSKKGLTLNKFDIQRNSDGIDYIKTTTPLFPEAQPIIQQPSQQQTSVPEATPLGNFRTYGEAYGTVERDNLIQELLDDGYSREDIQVQHIPATDTEDDYYLVKVRDNSQALVNAVTGSDIAPVTQKISLPGYEYFNDLYENTEVDATWKIPILQDLDSQLSTENTEDENLQILSQMDRVLQSPSQEDYEKAPTPQKEETNKRMEDYLKRNQQLNNLLDNEVGLQASEIRDTAETIMNTLSDIITEIQQHPEKAAEHWPTLKTDKDLSKLSRKEIVEVVNINRLMELAKKRFDDLKWSEDPAVDALYNSAHLLDQHDLIMDNWDAVMRFAGDIFVANEGFGIKRNSKKGNYETEVREYQGYDYDDYSSPQDPDAIAEEEDEQEHWQVEAKTIDAINSMSELVRMAIHNCYVLDKNGNKVLDKWGMPKRVDKHKAVKQILYWTAGTLNIHEMIDRLDAHKDRNPWVSQLTKRLSDTSGSEADFQSQFYGVMHRHFQLYGIGQYEDGHYVHKILNRHNALSEVMKGISAQFQMHQHQLFNRDSTINRENLKLLEGWYGELDAIKNKYKLTLVKSSGEGSREDYVSSNDLELSEADIETAAKAITAASRMLGYVTTEEQVLPIINKDSILRMTNALMLMLDHEGLRAQAQANTKDYKPFDFKTKNNIRGALSKFLQPMMEELEETALNTIFEDGKMYQSNTIPSFLSQLFDSFAQSEENFKPWVESFYGNSQWFKKDGIWRTPWLATMMSNPDARKAFEHHVQLNFNKHNYMRNMSPDEYIISCITNYFFKTTDEKEPDTTEAWFRVPIQSNKPSSEFIKFFSFRGTDYKDKIVAAMQSFFHQELDRIDTVRKRNKQEGDASAIASWDEQGRHFMFLPFLNSYLVDRGEPVSKEGNDLFRNVDGTVDTQKNNELKTLLNKKLDAEKALTPNEEVRLSKLVEEATRIYMQDRVNQILDSYEKNGILKAAEKVENIRDYGRSVRDNIENFLWNDFFAANNILQLTITDKAFYPTTAELQKRLAELHAPGTKANKYATDYQGNRVSDGTYRTILISDYEGFTANIIDNLTEIFNRKIAQAPEGEKEAWRILKDSLVGKDGRYRRINVTDGQAYSSPSSYRKKMLMFGKWSPEAERTYQKIRSGNFTLSDLEAVFQPLKPFVYGHLHKKMGVQNAPIQEMNVPFQAKNSEYLLLMADALMQGEDTGRPNLLRTIYDIMEESERLFPTKGIDTVQFNSAIKSGAQGVVHLSDFTESGAGREQAYTALRNQMYVKNDKGEIVDYNYDTFVQSTDYDNYALQQEVPKHFQDHQQAEPSQKRANIMSDLDMWLNPQGDKADPANINYYTWKDPDGTEHKLNAQEFRKEYEKVHAQNIEDSFNDLTKLFHLDSLDRVERNIALSELLQEEIESSPRYGIDLMQACQIDPKTGDFRIPKGDPVQSKRIEQLINSIIKSHINKQKLAGGPVVQVTNWGTSRQLHIRFNDKTGKLLMTKEEFIKELPYQTDDDKSKADASYETYIAENQAGIAHFEVFAPAAWKKHLEKFKNPDGTINLEAVERCDPNLLRMITSRIPNEDKYSIAHGKIVGFLPEVAGEAIMFPYELTEIDDSDFDVDKRYCHVFEIEDIVEDTPKIKKLLFKTVSDSYKKSHDGAEMPYNLKQKINDSINMLLDNPEVMRHTDKFSENLYNAYQNILHTKFPYKVKYPKKGSRGDRNNQILNMDWAVMSNEMTASKILNPGGFDIPKHDAYVIAVYRAKDGNIKWEQLEGMTTKQLQKLMPSAGDLAWFDTQVQFYKQNAAGSNLIGVFAVNKVAHAILEADDILVDIEDVCGKGNTFTIADKEFKGRMSLDQSQDDSGAYIGKGLGSMVGASADTAKDPWLDLIGINMTTAGVYNTLLRLGMPQKDAALFMSQDAIVSAINEFNRTNLKETTTFDAVISKKLAVLRNKYGYSENSEINKEPITRNELKAGLLPSGVYIGEYKDKIDYKVLLAFSKLQNLAKAIRKPTLVTRLNSISSAVGPLIIDNIILEHKLMQFLQSESQDNTGFYSSDGAPVDMDDLFYNHPMLRAFFKAFQFASNRFSDMPAGSTGFKGLIEAFPDNIKEKIYEDRQLLSKLSDFYQSYMLVTNEIIKPEQIGYYIKGFPEYFVKAKFKEKYPDNAFIQAIQTTFDKKAGRGFLNINTTGMMEQEKERLRMAWTDLHKVNPKLSTQLFTYAFFRGGIGFSPKTWMGLVSTYVKEHLTNQRADSALKTYVDTYRNFPTNAMVDEIIIEQFVRNNWDNSKLAPKKGREGTVYDYSELSKGILRVHAQKDKEDLQGIQFMKTTVDENTYLWKRATPMEDTDSSIEFQRIMPLGNNGQYMEMSLNENMAALEEVTELKQNNEQPELPNNAPKDAALSDDSSTPTPSSSTTQQAKTITDIVKYMITSRNLSENVAVDYVATLHKKAQDGTISKFSKQDIQRIAKDNGLNLDVDAALEWFKNLC